MICNNCKYLGVKFPHLKGYHGYEEWRNCKYPLPYHVTPGIIPIGIDHDCEVHKRKKRIK